MCSRTGLDADEVRYDGSGKKKQLEAAYIEKQLKRTERDDALEDELAAQASAVRANGREETRMSPYSKRFYTAVVIAVAVLIGLGVIAYRTVKLLGAPACRTHCCDGTCSSSTGPGTCSYHGGVCDPGAAGK